MINKKLKTYLTLKVIYIWPSVDDRPTTFLFFIQDVANHSYFFLLITFGILAEIG